MKENKEQWTEVISGEHQWLNFKLKEVWLYRDLIRLFVWRDFVAAYKQTLLGPLWHFINPFISTILYTIVFGVIAKVNMEGVPPFLFQLVSVACWGFFSRCLGVTQITFLGNAGIFGKVYFPRLTVPIAGVISTLIQLGIMILLMLIVWVYLWFNGANLQMNLVGLLSLPLVLLMAALLGMGIGAIIAALTTKYRDISLFVGYGISLMMYGSAVVYPLAAVPAEYKAYALYNPILHILEAFRYAFLNVGSFEIGWLLYSAGVSIVIFLLGVLAFNVTEKDFIDTV